MTQSAVVDSTYRIHAKDLQGLDLERRIINISYQGIEGMASVLHLEGVAKRLVLDQALSGQMMALTRSPIPEDWVGARIRLHASGEASDPTIVITGTDSSARHVRRLLAPIWDALADSNGQSIRCSGRACPNDLDGVSDRIDSLAGQTCSEAPFGRANTHHCGTRRRTIPPSLRSRAWWDLAYREGLVRWDTGRHSP